MSWPTSGWAEASKATTRDTSARNLDADFAKAVGLFKNGDAAGALDGFTRLSEVTDSPNVQLYIGYCQLELGRNREAHQTFSLTMKRAQASADGKYQATNDAAREQLAMLNQRMAKLTISVAQEDTDFEVTLDGKTLDPALLSSPVTIEPGVHLVEAKSTGAKRLSREVTLEKGDSKTMVLQFEKEATTPPQPLTAPPKPTIQPSVHDSNAYLTAFGVAAGGLGIVGFGTFAVAGLKSRSIYDRLRTECSSPCSDDAHRNAMTEGKSYQTVANIGLAIGIIGTISGATLLYLGTSSSKDGIPAVEVAPGSASISYRRSF